MTEWHIYVIAVAAWLLSYIKIPFKLLTARISDPTVRKRVNKIIILLPIIFSFAGVMIDMLIFGWTTDDFWATIIHHGINAAGIAIIIYSMVEKFFTGKSGSDYDGLVAFLASAGLGNTVKVKETIEKCLTLGPDNIDEYLGGILPEGLSPALKALIGSALHAYAEKQNETTAAVPQKDSV